MENWKDIAGFEGLYQTSFDGKIKALEKIRHTGKKGTTKRIYPEKILKPTVSGNRGYKIVTLCKNGETYYFTVHRLIALNHVDNPKKLPCVHHKDNDKLNCHSDNLIWCTHSENSKIAFDDGLQKGAFKSSGANISAIACINELTGEHYKSLKYAHFISAYKGCYETFLRRLNSNKNNTNIIKI